MIAALTVVSTPASSSAQIVAGGNVGGFGTFIDQQTGLQWLRLDNFFNATPFAMVAAAGAEGFTLASLSDVQTLWTSLPLGGGQWASYETVMGGAPNRNLIWGLYDVGSTANQGWGYAFDFDTDWVSSAQSYSWNFVPNSDSDTRLTDLNLWAYRSGGEADVVPEPATMTLLATGLAGMAAARRKKRNA